MPPLTRARPVPAVPRPCSPASGSWLGSCSAAACRAARPPGSAAAPARVSEKVSEWVPLFRLGCGTRHRGCQRTVLCRMLATSMRPPPIYVWRLRPSVLKHLEHERAYPAQPGPLPHELGQHSLGVLGSFRVCLLGSTRRCRHGHVVSTRLSTRRMCGNGRHGRGLCSRWLRRGRRRCGRRWRTALQLLQQAEHQLCRRRARRLGAVS